MCRLSLFLFFIAMLGACASKRPVHAPIIEEVEEQALVIQIADQESMAGCRYIDSVYGTSSWYGVFAETGIRNARESAFEKAQNLGGTHIVWETTPQGYGSSQVAGKVYKCGK